MSVVPGSLCAHGERGGWIGLHPVWGGMGKRVCPWMRQRARGQAKLARNTRYPIPFRGGGRVDVHRFLLSVVVAGA